MEFTNEELLSVNKKIEALDFSKTIYKMVNYWGWLEKDAHEVCKQYKRYLFLKFKYGKHHELPPSECIDEFWHLHILDTKRYATDCKNIFGRFIHHYPFFGIDDKSDILDLNAAFAKVQELYEKEFGEKLKVVRRPWLEPILKAIRRPRLMRRPLKQR